MTAWYRFDWGVLLAALIAILLAGCSAPATPALVDRPAGSLHANIPATATPFRPLQPTQPGLALFSFDPSGAPAPPPLEAAARQGNQPSLEVFTPTPELVPFFAQNLASQPVAANDPTLNFQGIDLESRKQVDIIIHPSDRRVNKGKPIKISFKPGERCKFGDHKGCVYAYKPSLTGNVIIITIHSGVGGEGQRLRGALEGTGINRAGLALKQVQANLQALDGATVTIRQGERILEGLEIGGMTRIPPRALKRYFRADLSEILDIAADLDAHMLPWVQTAEPILVLETCGWKMPGEPGSEQTSDTTGSVYLGVIH